MNIIEQYALGDERSKEEVMEKLDKAEEELNRSGQSAVSITALKRERLIGSAMELRINASERHGMGRKKVRLHERPCTWS